MDSSLGCVLCIDRGQTGGLARVDAVQPQFHKHYAKLVGQLEQVFLVRFISLSLMQK